MKMVLAFLLGVIVLCAGCGSSASAKLPSLVVFRASADYGHATDIQTRAFHVPANWELQYFATCQQDPSSTMPGGMITVNVQPGRSRNMYAADILDVAEKDANEPSFDGYKEEKKGGYYRLTVTATEYCEWSIRILR